MDLTEKKQASASDAIRDPALPLPTLQNYQKHQEESKTTGQSIYSELVADKFDTSVDPMTHLKSQFSSLKDKTPEERARIGGRFGAHMGAMGNGVVGGILGAGIGAVVGRGLGLVQTGEHEDGIRLEKTFDALRTLKIANDKNQIKFDDGGEFQLTTDPSFRLRNTDSVMSGQIDRALTEIDASNPLTKRTTNVAKPFAYYMAQGMHQWADPKNPRDVKALENTNALLVNALQNGASNINQVYDRARSAVKQYGLSEDSMRSFFSSIKEKIPNADALQIREGLDTIFKS